MLGRIDDVSGGFRPEGTEVKSGRHSRPQRSRVALIAGRIRNTIEYLQPPLLPRLSRLLPAKRCRENEKTRTILGGKNLMVTSWNRTCVGSTTLHRLVFTALQRRFTPVRGGDKTKQRVTSTPLPPPPHQLLPTGQSEVETLLNEFLSTGTFSVIPRLDTVLDLH
ncbi:unnamed protein product [Pleuronectes platessa]|uniref:Uncharacterized protein n=1 Tax=Pleuronectes platessa TaxID=8262 RepID=A0A9N7UJR5_PLEPL|nr:unnamed protein product [Pleuronectes platessa]